MLQHVCAVSKYRHIACSDKRQYIAESVLLPQPLQPHQSANLDALADEAPDRELGCAR